MAISSEMEMLQIFSFYPIRCRFAVRLSFLRGLLAQLVAQHVVLYIKCTTNQSK